VGHGGAMWVLVGLDGFTCVYVCLGLSKWVKVGLYSWVWVWVGLGGARRG
jgi:hypothetical protein